MSKLIQLRHRIKAIETIKKITHAMRLIAMSSHSQLKHSQATITLYTHELEAIFNELRFHVPKWHHPILNPSVKKNHKTAIIIVGSQKGLCGSFNNNLFKLVTSHLKDLQDQQIDIISVGQKAVDFSSQLPNVTIKKGYPAFSIRLISSIASEIAHSLFQANPPYSSVLVISNRFKSFFLQKPKISHIIPEEYPDASTSAGKEELIWEQNAQDSLENLALSYLTAQIQLLLFDSLLAEHAARFVSMDSATRNANSILEATKLEYNKLRQAKITKELTELTSSH